MTSPFYIVLIAESDEHHSQLVTMLIPAVGNQISYIDVKPQVREEDGQKWLGVNR